MSQYDYTKTPVSLDRLAKEIQDSSIVTALDHINWTGTDLAVFFKAELSAGDESVLEDIIDAHTGEPLIINLPTEVVTQFEKDDKILKLARGSGTVDSNGQAIIEIIVPGTFSGVNPNSSDGRFVDAGRIWISDGQDGDCVKKVEIVDASNKIGYGAGVVIGRWHDDEAEVTANEGWWIPKTAGGISVDSMGGYGFIPSEMVLRLTIQRAAGVTTGTAYLNLKWGKQE